MTDKLRPRPYVWPTWITKHLAGEEKCWYKPWVKATRKYKKIPESADRRAFFDEWTAKHDKLVLARYNRMKADGWTCRLEDEGEFKLQGKTADLAGKPDIVGMRTTDTGDFAIVIDGKSGRPKASDHWQVLIYMFALPLSWLPKSYELHGEIQYTDNTEPVRPLRDAEVQAISGAIRKISDLSSPPDAVPSARECERCDVASCKSRHKAAPAGDARGYF